MSEEEILDDINFCLEGEYITREHYEAIQGLLDLYNKEKLNSLKLTEQLNKEKEKNIKLQKRNDRQVKIINKRDKKIEELKEIANKDWEERCRLTFKLEDCISKDKIREFALSESQADTYHFKTVSLDRLLKFLEEE